MSFNRYCPKKVCKLQSSYICSEFKNQTKNNETPIQFKKLMKERYLKPNWGYMIDYQQ